jgi:hypothetical protein
MQKITNKKNRKISLTMTKLYMCIVLINISATAQQSPENLGQDCSNLYAQSNLNSYVPTTFQQPYFEPFFPNQLLGNPYFLPTYNYSNYSMKNFGKGWDLNASNPQNPIAFQNKEKFQFKPPTINCDFVLQNADSLKEQNNKLLKETTKQLEEIYKNYEGVSV